MCITFLGAQESDYSESDVELNNKEMTEQQEKEVADVTAENEVQDADSGDHETNIGKISFVSCATGSSHPASDVSTNRGMLVRLSHVYSKCWYYHNFLFAENISIYFLFIHKFAIC